MAGKARHILRAAAARDRAVARRRRGADHVDPAKLERERQIVFEGDIHQTGRPLDERRPRFVILGDRRVLLEVDVDLLLHVRRRLECEREALGFALAYQLGLLDRHKLGVDVRFGAGNKAELRLVGCAVDVVNGRGEAGREQ